MDLAALETALKKWWKPILPLGTGATNCALYAGDGKQPMVNPTLKAQAFYSFTSLRRLGTEETSHTVSGVTGKLIPSVNGVRTLGLTIRVDSYDQRAGYTAHTIAERARTRIALPKTLETLALAGYAVIDTGPILALPFSVDDRVMSRAAFEFKLGVLSIESDTDVDNERDQIDSTEIDSDTLDDTGGTPLDEQINLTVTRP